MLPEAELRVVLSTAPLREVPGPWSKAVAFRHLQGPPPGGETGDPPQPLWPGGAPRYGARFTPRGSFGTIYLASDIETALREVGAIFRPTITIPGEPWVVVPVEGSLAAVLDLTDVALQDLIGSSLQELTGTWRIQPPGREAPTHTLGRLAYETGRIVGIRYISAKNPERGTNVAVFVDRLVAGAGRSGFLRAVDPHSHLAQRFP
jgi:RES domain-containing protein